jgi:hypothetical protein
MEKRKLDILKEVYPSLSYENLEKMLGYVDGDLSDALDLLRATTDQPTISQSETRPKQEDYAITVLRATAVEPVSLQSQLYPEQLSDGDEDWESESSVSSTQEDGDTFSKPVVVVLKKPELMRIGVRRSFCRLAKIIPICYF